MSSASNLLWEKILAGRIILRLTHNNSEAPAHVLIEIDKAFLNHIRKQSPPDSNSPYQYLNQLRSANVINAEDITFISNMHALQNKLAHGDKVKINSKNVERYIALIENILNNKVRQIQDEHPIKAENDSLSNAQNATIDAKQRSSDDINNQLTLLASHRRTLQHYLEQRASLGSQFIPPGVRNGVYDSRQEILRIKEVLRGWDIAIEDHPNDDEPPKNIISPTVTPMREAPKLNYATLHTRRSLQVFLCHSSGDKPAVRKLYQRLHSEDIQPWLDEEDLVPGQDWAAEIPKAVRASDIVVVCLSRHSVTKVGYVQKEIKILGKEIMI